MPSVRPIIRTLILLAALVGVTTALLIYPSAALWRGSWGETAAATQSATRVTYVLVAALSAVVAGEWQPRRTSWLTAGAVRTGHRLHAPLVGSLWGASAAAMLGATLPAVAWTARESTFGTPPIGGLLLPPVAALLWVAVGYSAGRTVPMLFAIPLVSLIAYGSALVLDPFASPWALPLASVVVADDRQRTFLRELWWVSIAKMAFYLGLALTILAVSTGSLRRRRSALALPTGLVLALLLWVGPSGLAVDEDALRPICSDLSSAKHHVSLCLPQARNHARQWIAEAFNDVGSYLPEGLTIVDDSVREEDMRGARFSSTSGGREAHRPSHGEVVQSFLWDQFGRCNSLSGSTRAAGRMSNLVHVYLDAASPPGREALFAMPAPPVEAFSWTGPSSLVLGRWNSMTNAEKDAFIRQNWFDISACRV